MEVINGTYETDGSCCSSCAAHERVRADAFKGVQKPASLTRAQKTELWRLAAALLLGVAGFFLWEKAVGLAGRSVAAVILGTAYLLAGYDVLLGAARNILKGRVFDELFLMSIASLGAFAIGAMEEAVGVMIFYKIGEFLQERAADNSRRSIKTLLALRPDTARVFRDGQWVELPAGEVVPGDSLLVRPGERVPVDGTVTEGAGSFDTSSMTGESLPRPALPGDEALAGFISRDGALSIRAEKPASDSAAARIIELVENASKSKARTELFISRFAAWYTPAVVGAALLIALIPPLFVPGQVFSDWIYRALVLLVISCPCAFVISVPLGYFGGLGGAARRGILIKGASVLDALADVGTVVFDKTGTLTDGKFAVAELRPENGFDEVGLLRHAAAAGTHSNHPLARAIRAAWDATGSPRPGCDEGSYAEIPGHGTMARTGGTEVLAGGDKLLHLREIPHRCMDGPDTVIHVAVAGRYAGRIELGDRLKKDAAKAMDELRNLGIHRVAMLTGDGEFPARKAAAAAGVDEVHHGLLPEGKLQRLEAILNQERGKGSVLFVGDGMNDAPVLARADAGIAMGGAGSDAAVESADVVLMTDEPSRVAEAISRAKKTRRIVVQNIAFALGVKLVVLSLGAFGLAAMWEAVIADVGVALLAVLNATRALK
ncbi:MAG: cadmium-translocating P-type ATPase [Spirochaetales bacterium]|nr:MAG: cadmium-translocating P-type ATPase [Spirochaetales bacterium]